MDGGGGGGWRVEYKERESLKGQTGGHWLDRRAPGIDMDVTGPPASMKERED